MNDRLKIFAALAALTAGVAWSITIHHQADLQLRHLQEESDDQSRDFTAYAAENLRLSNMFSGATNERPITGEKLAELLKLRNEVAQLRRSNAEIARLQSRNQKLRAAVDKNGAQLAAAKLLPNYWPKDQLSDAGFADPSSAMKSILAAMLNGEVSAWSNICTPGAFGKLEEEWKQSEYSPEKQNAEAKSMANQLVSSAEGFHIIDTSQPQPDTALVQLSFDGQNKSRTFILKRIGEEWKFDDLAAGGTPASLPQ